MKPSRNYVIAAVLAGVTALINTIYSLGAVPAGPWPNKAPVFVLVLLIVIGLIGLVSAYGVWRLWRIGVVLTIITSALNILLSAPGIPFAPSTWEQVNFTMATVLSTVVIYLLLRRDGKPKGAAELTT